MPQIINTNISSLNAQRNLNTSQSALATSLQRLSSGLRINSAKDDAAGLAISDRMTSQIRGLNQASRNANDGVSLAQTAESGLAEVGNNLQRIRELAVQSANATNTASDRASLNAEVVQLLAEIQRVATTSQFNGQNILDGTFTTAQFQVGANANQTITASTGNAQTNALGSYQAAATAVTGAALAGGDLYINDFAVGAASGNAESIAAAINAITTQTGVTASATTSVTSSNALHKAVGILSGDLEINGINIGAIGGASSTSAQGASIAAAINLKTAQTGVSAVANSTNGQLTLNSNTGKNILITSGTAAGASRVEAASGLEVTTATTYTDTFTFAAGTLGDSTLTANANGAVTNGDTYTLNGIAFTYGTGTDTATVKYVGDATVGATSGDDNLALLRTKILATTAITDNATISAITVNAGTGDNTFTVTSKIASASTSNYLATTTTASAPANTTAGVGVTVGGTFKVGGQTFEFLKVGGTITTAGNVGVTIGASGTETAANFAAALTAQNTSATAPNYVTASRTTNVVTLTSNKLGSEGLAEVNNNSVGSFTGVTVGAGTGTTDSAAGSTQNTTYGTLTLNSASTFGINGSNGTAAGLTAAGLSGGNVTLSGINTVDISTVTGANNAISLIDGALSQVATIRGTMGALQNRFNSVVSSLTASSENLSAARSRIQDADFASETAQLTRNSILQQAGTAMLAQANALPQNVLTLLQG